MLKKYLITAGVVLAVLVVVFRFAPAKVRQAIIGA
jgi:hypothetical protein